MSSLENNMDTEKSKRWTLDEVAQLIDLWSQNLSNAEIATILGRQEAAVAVKASRINLPRKTTSAAQKKPVPAAKKGKVRNCLRCEKTFFSTWSGNRICDSCKESADWRNGSNYYTS